MASAKGSTAIPHPSLDFKTTFAMLKQSAAAWSDDKASRLAAALSYYTIFSIAPLLIIAIGVVGLFFGQEAASNQVFQQIRGLVGDEGAKAIQTMVQSAHEKSAFPGEKRLRQDPARAFILAMDGDRHPIPVADGPPSARTIRAAPAGSGRWTTGSRR